MTISLKWFKAQIKTIVETAVEKRVDLAVKELESEQSQEYVKPYINVKLVNDVLTIVLKDGDILTKPFATIADFENAKSSRTYQDLLDIMMSEQGVEDFIKREKAVENAKILYSGIDSLRELEDFVIEDNSVYLSGIHRSLPQLLIEKFILIVGTYEGLSLEEKQERLNNNDEYVGLKRFFMWSCLNPRAEVADKLYDFLSKNGMKVTKQGFFIALRNVVDNNQDQSEIVHFISNAYNKVKAVWKKKPENYRVVNRGGELSIELVTNTNVIGNILGNLDTLYIDLPNMTENRFTDNWTRTFDIRIGQVVSMPMEDCNWSTQDCATAGLK